MKIKKYVAFLSCLAISMLSFVVKAQTKATLFDGTIVAGYVDHGAYLNCVGPSIKFSKKPFSISAGLLPSLRIKEDKVPSGATKNSLLTPNLGFGLTAAFHHFAVQLPFYYNAKTAVKNGEWNVGAGLGYKF
ncbi:hypothetical protein [Pedobacter sp. Leaf176]|uniref:hypothetical protein n=1 Tax=Pedobacter sp. Leaf176 TaxID=1736286 RepID=UPI000A594D78|nr:hypothetical protein [Pedobacter sp. Leaf176]